MISFQIPEDFIPKFPDILSRHNSSALVSVKPRPSAGAKGYGATGRDGGGTVPQRPACLAGVPRKTPLPFPG